MPTWTAFAGDIHVATGEPRTVAEKAPDTALVFDEATGRVVDRGPDGWELPSAGRPKLGVTSREVTLLPRHWDWLKGQPKSASASLRRLVEAASRSESSSDELKATYGMISVLAGDLPGFEEVSRALFSESPGAAVYAAADWPPDVHALLVRRLRALPVPGFSTPTHAAGKAFVMRQLAGPVDMLNLLRFRETADYSKTPQLAPEEAISGREAYERYIAHTMPFLAEAGAELVYDGAGGSWLIGPTDEAWDRMLIVRHRSTEAFMTFAYNDDYLAGVGHRTAALTDSRLLPLTTSRPS